MWVHGAVFVKDFTFPAESRKVPDPSERPDTGSLHDPRRGNGGFCTPPCGDSYSRGFPARGFPGLWAGGRNQYDFLSFLKPSSLESTPSDLATLRMWSSE